MHQTSKIYFVTKLYMFRASSVPIIRSFQRTLGDWYVSCKSCGRFLGGSGSKLTLLGSSHIICMKHTNRQVYSHKSWWWAQKMPETCRVLWQNNFWIFDASSWLFYTMHGHLNIKKKCIYTVYTVHIYSTGPYAH
jgi:hypothetical protein